MGIPEEEAAAALMGIPAADDADGDMENRNLVKLNQIQIKKTTH